MTECAAPTVPMRMSPGGLTWLTPAHSVMPYPSLILTPMPWNQWSSSWLMGAAPETGSLQRRRPRRSWRGRKTSRSAIRQVMRSFAVMVPASRRSEMARPTRAAQLYSPRLSRVESLILSCTDAAIFSQIRGTPRKTVGLTSRRSVWIVPIDSPKCTTAPTLSGRKTEKIFSAT